MQDDKALGPVSLELLVYFHYLLHFKAIVPIIQTLEVNERSSESHLPSGKANWSGRTLPPYLDLSFVLIMEGGGRDISKEQSGGH